GFEVRIPPLRERTSDLPDLVAHFQGRFQRDLGLPEPGAPSPAVLALLAAHPWPGNVRELGHVVRRALIEGGSLEDAGTVARMLGGAEPELAGSLPTQSPMSFTPPFLPLEELEQAYILAVLSHCGGNKTEAARLLGIERKTLARKLRRPEGPDPDESERDL
ncbi:MAG: hypothetical protein KGI56_10955, partial [Acidobacteriota bacterium]|nr:hypothetical protein [Acidobacteriota bacterium]